jgi:hypothetical protein
MNISTSQKKKISDYYELLIKQFIKEKTLHKKIKILFQEQEIEGLSYYEANFYYSYF